MVLPDVNVEISNLPQFDWYSVSQLGILYKETDYSAAKCAILEILLADGISISEYAVKYTSGNLTNAILERYSTVYDFFLKTHRGKAGKVTGFVGNSMHGLEKKGLLLSISPNYWLNRPFFNSRQYVDLWSKYRKF